MAVAASYEQANASPSPLPPRDDSRPGSTSNATLQTLSNAKRSRTSCRSTTADSARRRRRQERQQAVRDFGADGVEQERADGLGVEPRAGQLALRPPVVAVGVDDAAAEQVLERGDVAGALGVVAEVGLDDVLHIGRGGGEDDAGEGDGVGRAGLEALRRPVEEAVAVLYELVEVESGSLFAAAASDLLLDDVEEEEDDREGEKDQ
ncbi:putative cytochrome P450 94B3-like [Iris pallida]|uniref:Cytochrome P450 94B3-like n=1 Tax=Iris pallida TaxID=29817 RepID=A0AAX6GM27_IRIPA|nr:putative cytochrome P450 94B3-like [Iris pallida]